MRRILLVPIALALVLVPTVQATQGHGNLDVRSSGGIHGPVTVDGEAVTLFHATDRSGSLVLEGSFTVTRETVVRHENGSTEQNRTTRSFDDARLSLLNESAASVNLTGSLAVQDLTTDGYGRTDDPSVVLMAGRVRSGQTTLRVGTTGSTDGSPTQRAGSGDGQPQERNVSGFEVRSFERGNLSLAPRRTVHHTGAVDVLLLSGRLRVDPSGDTYRTGVEHGTRTVCDQQVGGQCVVSHEERVTWVNRTSVRAADGDLTVEAGGTLRPTMQRSQSGDRADLTVGPPTVAYADRFDLDMNATLHVEDATGRLVVGEETFTFDGDPVSVGGLLDVRLTPRDDGYHAQLEGDVRYVKAPTPRTFPPEVVAGAAVGFGALAVAVAYLYPALKFAATKLVVGPFYAQVEGDDVLDNETRATIFEAIQDDPGVSASDLARTAGCGWGTAVYHLAVLEQNGMIVSTRDGRHRRFFPYSGMDFRHKDVFSAIQNETTAAVLNSVRTSPGIHQKALRREVGVAASTVNWHISKLEDAGLVEKRRDGRKVTYYPGPKVDLLDRDAA